MNQVKYPYIAICVPATDMVKTPFVSDLVHAVTAWTLAGQNCVLFVSQGTVLPSQRHDLVLKARREDCSHVLWLDSDMRFPPDLFEQLVKHNELVVGANCAKRRMPTIPTAGNYVNGRKKAVFSDPDSHGLEKVDSVGTGVLLVSMEVYDSIPAPWFLTPWDEKAGGYQGEDMYFCWLVRKAGIPIYIDHDLSKQIGHVGEWEYRHEHTWAVRDQKEVEEAEARKPFALEVEA